MNKNNILKKLLLIFVILVVFVIIIIYSSLHVKKFEYYKEDQIQEEINKSNIDLFPRATGGSAIEIKVR